MEITMHRGDVQPVSFTARYEDGAPITPVDRAHFTVKRDFSSSVPLFQKKLSDGTIIELAEGEYGFYIEASDTDNLEYGDYVCDIQIASDLKHIKKTLTGTLTVTEEATFAGNE